MDDEIKYCSNRFCDAEAVAYVNDGSTRYYMCRGCAEVFKLGQELSGEYIETLERQEVG